MKSKNPKPPRIAAWILNLIARRDDEFSLSGDFDEEFLEIARERGPRHARTWYRRHLLRSIPLILRDTCYWSFAMFNNYVKVAFRNLMRQKVYASINILGLAVGLGVFFIGALLTDYNYNFDTFHRNPERIFGVVQEYSSGIASEQRSAVVPAPLLPAMLRDFPEIEDGTRISFAPKMIVRRQNDNFYEYWVSFADPNFLEFFTFEMAEGDPGTALSAPNSVVITEKTALKYFGDENPLGKTLTLEGNINVTVTGILKDIPVNSSIRFDFLVSMETAEALYGWKDDWKTDSQAAFLRLPEGFDRERLENKFSAFIGKYYDESPESPDRLYLLPLLSFHLDSRNIKSFLYYLQPENFIIFNAVSAIFLLIVCINIMNLSTARAQTRAKEVGLRKVVGAQRHNLVKQFLGESVLLALIAMPAGIIVYKLMLPAFLRLVDDTADISIWNNPGIVFLLVVITVLTGIFSGSYPAFFISKFKPAQILKSNWSSGLSGTWMRKLLVIAQFSFSIIFIVLTVLMKNQSDYIQNVNLGYDNSRIIGVAVTGETRGSIPLLREELLRHTDITGASAAVSLPGSWRSIGQVQTETADETDAHTMNVYGVDYDFIELIGLQVTGGRSFKREFADEDKYIINETAARRMLLDDPVGTELMVDGRKGTVIGVTNDFHFQGLHRPMSPIVLKIDRENVRFMLIKYAAGASVSDIKKFIGEKWRLFAPNTPVQQILLTDHMYDAHKGAGMLAKFVGVVSLFAIFFSCFGILGLASFTIERKTKEIGVRKALGASAADIIRKFSIEYIKLIAVANIIALPVAYFISSELLGIVVMESSFRADIGAGVFFLTAVVTLLAGFLAVTSQTLKAAYANPVDSLRYE